MSAERRRGGPPTATSVLARVTVEEVARLSPTFVRIVVGGAGLADFGTPGRVLDQRIKLVFPGADGLPVLGEDWWGDWQALPEASRGAMRTYSIRELRVVGTVTRVVIDFVLHLAPGRSGPASQWASRAVPGDELLVSGPRRGIAGRGIEYAPEGARRILLAGDETAAPAIARILEDESRDRVGIAVIEVPVAADELAIDAPRGVEVRWLPRDGRRHGARLIPAVLGCFGGRAEAPIAAVDTEALLWETPTYSGLGEPIVGATPDAEQYIWIAGESGVVTTLRRQLVAGLGIDRARVAFMGYWRDGVAMRG